MNPPSITSLVTHHDVILGLRPAPPRLESLSQGGEQLRAAVDHPAGGLALGEVGDQLAGAPHGALVLVAEELDQLGDQLEHHVHLEGNKWLVFFATVRFRNRCQIFRAVKWLVTDCILSGAKICNLGIGR